MNLLLQEQVQIGEKPRPLAFSSAAEIEWWSIHLELDTHATLHACFWVHQSGLRRPGVMASYVLQDESRCSSRCLVDSGYFSHIRNMLRKVQTRKNDPFLRTALEMTSDDRLFEPYELAASHLNRDEAGIEMEIGPCRLELESTGWRLEIQDSELSLSVCLPRIRATSPIESETSVENRGLSLVANQLPAKWQLVEKDGRRAGTASAWLNHQWGEWTISRHFAQSYFHPEWQDFFVSLESGERLYVRRAQVPGVDGRGHRVSSALLQMPDGSVRTLGDLEIMEQESFDSLTTNNIYPCRWRMFHRSSGLDLAVRSASGLELPILSHHRAVYEGSLEVTGMINGESTRGSGYAELFGAAFDINRFFWGQGRGRVAEQLETFIPRRANHRWLERISQSTSPLHLDLAEVQRSLIDPIWSMMDRGGKGWRSAWLMLCCQALGERNLDRRLRPFMAIIELLHTGSLVIDDIEDGSDLRRGRAALHVETGTDIAINAGNFMYFLPLQIIEDATWLDAVQKAAIYRHVSVAMRQGHIGQAMDLVSQHRRYALGDELDVTAVRRQLIEQYRFKSGCQLEAVARIAGELVRADSSLVAPLSVHSANFGVAYQIVDDCVDIQSAGVNLGKHNGEDFANGKLNMVLLHALDGASLDDRRWLLENMGKGHSPDNLSRLRCIVRETSALNRALDDAESLLEESWRDLEALPLTDAKVVIRSVPRWLIEQRRAAAG